MNRTKIQWTDTTWNVLRGCSRVSSGCEQCYAEKIAARFSGPGLAYEGLARRAPNGEARWTGKVRLVESLLGAPLKWRTPRRVFVNSMSDLFHESVPGDWIDQIFAVMALAPQHTFQILTKRPERMRAYMEELAEGKRQLVNASAPFRAAGDTESVHRILNAIEGGLRNLWLGVSIEDQATADARIPLLLKTPAAVRWVSAEPLLGAVDLRAYLTTPAVAGHCIDIDGGWWHAPGACRGAAANCSGCCRPWLDWIVAGGESGASARPCDVAWVRSIVEQCQGARVPCFVKQLGTRPVAGLHVEPHQQFEQAAESIMRHGEYDPDPIAYECRSRSGADPDEWPEDLRVREFPDVHP